MKKIHLQTDTANILKKVQNQIEHDSELLKKRASISKKIYQLQVDNKIPLTGERKIKFDPPNVIYHQHQAMLEKTVPDPSIPRIPFDYSLGGIDFPKCRLTENLFCESCNDPVIPPWWQESDPPDNLDQHFYFENYLVDQCQQSFKLHCIFPLNSVLGPFNSAQVYFQYNFTKQVNSSGYYCFLPLPWLVGYVGCFGTGDRNAWFIASLHYAIRQNGESLGAGSGQYGVEMHPSSDPLDIIPLNLRQKEFGLQKTSIYLDSSYHTAEIKVIFGLFFHNGYNTGDLHFLFDTYNDYGFQVGWLNNRTIKFGKKNALRFPWMLRH